MAYLLSRLIYLRKQMMRNQLTMGNQMMLFAGASLGFTFLICMISIICISNFGYGLKPLLLVNGKNHGEDYAFQPLEYRGGHHSFVSQRFDLD